MLLSISILFKLFPELSANDEPYLTNRLLLSYDGINNLVPMFDAEIIIESKFLFNCMGESRYFEEFQFEISEPTGNLIFNRTKQTSIIIGLDEL